MRDVLYCPGCQRRLQFPDEALGRAVQCPSCQRVFTAEVNLTTPPASALAKSVAAPARPTSRSYDDPELDKARGTRRDGDDDRTRGPRRPAPHRGGEILTFGLLALLPCCLTSVIFGIIAWMMANSDLAEMRSGRMDREGEGLSQAGRALGIAGLILWPGIVTCGVSFNLFGR
ncbi:MAG: DUF4190 domain-containing protein [Planctomycetota bacterium]|jgi:hypothetical protein